MRAYFSFGERAGVEVVVVIIAMVSSAPRGSANTLRMATSTFCDSFISFLPLRTTTPIFFLSKTTTTTKTIVSFF
jgi:hypothetical protein